MAGTAWFFSTMAQASAAIAGLIIAFSAVHYQLERQQLEKRTEKLRDELISLRRKYYNVIKLMADALSPNPSQIETWSQETEQCISDPLGINADGLEDTIQEADGIENPTTMCMYAHLSRIVELFKEIEESPKPELDYLLSSHQFAEMRKSTRLLAELFEPPYDDIESLYTEIDDGSTEVRSPDYRWAQIFETDDVEGKAAKEVAEWTATHRPDTVETNILLNQANKGLSLASWGNILVQLREDFQSVDSRKGNTIVDNPPSHVRTVIDVSAILIITGVFLPVLFLITPPQQWITITGWPLFLLEIVLLILTGVITGYLLYVIRMNMSVESR